VRAAQRVRPRFRRPTSGRSESLWRHRVPPVVDACIAQTFRPPGILARCVARVALRARLASCPRTAVEHVRLPLHGVRDRQLRRPRVVVAVVLGQFRERMLGDIQAIDLAECSLVAVERSRRRCRVLGWSTKTQSKWRIASNWLSAAVFDRACPSCVAASSLYTFVVLLTCGALPHFHCLMWLR
jgi:hypothetical protein